MRIAIIADIHANLEATVAVLREIDKRGAEMIVCLGDHAGYNAQPNEVIDLIRERGILTLMGNHDAAACGLEEGWFFRSSAKKAIDWQVEHIRDDNREWLKRLPEQLPFERAYLGVHGSPGNRDDYIVDWLDAMRQLSSLKSPAIAVCFFGHSHRASFFSERGGTYATTCGTVHELRHGNRYFINPGAVGQPRDRDPRAAFGLFDLERMTFEFCRVEYDVESVARKVLQAGLPPDLAARLAKGV
ncbi:MAG: metallophosphoesterase family protein [Candidatus Hydrogenedentes bacterium]|nr:metallophosphoesterase family protein [Candidatus Hydrogenedentota bacterium]